MRNLSPSEYEKLTNKQKGDHLVNSLLDQAGQNAEVLDQVVKRLTRRPIRYDVEYNTIGQIKTVTPVYGDVSQA